MCVFMCVCTTQVDDLSRAERESLLRNEPRPAIKPFKGNKLLLRFATQGEPPCLWGHAHQDGDSQTLKPT